MTLWQSFISVFENFGFQPDDSQEIKVQKATLVAMTLIAGSLAGIFGTIFYYYDLIVVAFIAYFYFIASYVGLIYFWFRKSLNFLKYSQLILAIFLPFFATIEMGGFSLSGMVIVWSLLTPFGALFYANYKNAPYLYLLFIILLLLSGIIGYFIKPEVVLPDMVIELFFLMNIGGMSSIIFLVVYYFVDEKEKAVEILNKLAEEQFSDLIKILNLDSSNLDKNSVKSEPVIFMIMSPSGVAIYSKVFSANQKFDYQLISGFFSAISSIGQGAFGAKILREISYKNFYLFFELIKDYRIVFASSGDYLNSRSKFSTITQKLNQYEFNFVFDNQYLSLNNNETLNAIIDSIFIDNN